MRTIFINKPTLLAILCFNMSSELNQKLKKAADSPKESIHFVFDVDETVLLTEFERLTTDIQFLFYALNFGRLTVK